MEETKRSARLENAAGDNGRAEGTTSLSLPETGQLPEELRKNWLQEPLLEVMDYILRRHHALCRQAIATIESLLAEISRHHEGSYPELKRIQTLFGKFSTELLRHLVKEEDTLFPYIARMEAAVSSKEAFPRPSYGTVALPIRMMVMEHHASNEDFNQIRQACHNYECLPGAASNLQALYQALGELEQDLRAHSDLEDKVLFPRAIALEQELESPGKDSTHASR